MNFKNYFYLPLYLFIWSWLFVFLMLFFLPPNYFKPSITTIFYVFAGILAVILGYIFYRLFFLNQEIGFSDCTIHKLVKIDYSKLVWIVVILSVFTILTIYLMLSVLAEARGGLANYFANPIMSRQLVSAANDGRVWSLSLAFASYGGSLIFIVTVLGGLLFFSSKTTHKIISLIPLLMGILYGISTFSRYTIITLISYWILTIVFFSYYTDTKTRKKTLINLGLLILVLIALILFTFYLIVALRSFTSEKSIFDIFLDQLYYYIVGNVIGLEQFFDQFKSFYWGRGIFRTILKWINRLDIVDNLIIPSTRFNFVKISPTHHINTYAFIRPFYEDFGVVGLMSLSFLWGVVTAKSLKKLQSGFTLFRLYIVIVITYSLIMSFFGFYLLYISKILYELLIAVFMQKLTVKIIRSDK